MAAVNTIAPTTEEVEPIVQMICDLIIAWRKEAFKNEATVNLISKVKTIHGIDPRKSKAMPFDIVIKGKGEIVVPSYNNPYANKEVKLETPGIEIFNTREKNSYYLLNDISDDVNICKVDLEIISPAEAVDGEPSPLVQVLKDFKPTISNARDKKFTSVRVGNRGWMDIPFEITADIGDYVDEAGNIVPNTETIGKVTKYINPLFSPCGAHLIESAKGFRVMHIEDAWEAINFEVYGDLFREYDKRFVDGAMLFSRGLWARMIRQTIDSLSMDDPYREQKINKLRMAECAIVRVITPDGMEKGLAIKSHRDFGPWDILSSNENFKTNLKSTDGRVWIWAQPHVAHDEDVAGDAGSMLSLPFFFNNDDDVKEDIDSYFAEADKIITEGDIKPVKERILDGEDDTIASFQRRFNSVVEAGLTIQQFPYLYRSFMDGKKKGISQENRWLKNKKGDTQKFLRYDRMRWAIRGSVRAQMVSNIWARLAGMVPANWDIKDDHIRLVNGMAIMSDATFSKNYHKHGGHDLDDKIVLVSFLDLATNTVRLFGYRQPCSWGEFAVYDIDGSMEEVPEPCRALNSNNFPKVDIAAMMEAKIEHKRTTGEGWVLPSKFLKPQPRCTMPLSKAMLLNEAKRQIDNPLSKYILTIGVFYALVTSVTGEVPFAQLGTHEDVVDAMTQASAAMDFKAVSDATDAILAELLEATGGKIDKGLMGRLGQKAIKGVTLYEGRYSEVGEYFRTKLGEFVARIEVLHTDSKANHKVNVPLRLRANHTLKQQAAPLNKHFRAALEHTPGSRWNDDAKRYERTYAEMAMVGNVVFSATKDIAPGDMNWAICAYLWSYDKAEQNMSNGEFLSRYITFMKRVYKV